MQEETREAQANYIEACEKLKMPESFSMEDIAEAAQTNFEAISHCAVANVKLCCRFLARGF